MTNIKPVVVDGSGHLLGRLASVVAKQLLNGQRVVITRCEDLNMSGSLFRNKLIFEAFLRKRMNTNPRKGPIHYRSPARILWRTIRGMLPHKTARGQAALGRLRCFEGVPQPYDKMKRVVVPAAVRNIRLKPNRKYCRVGDLAEKVGWHHNDLIKRLEDKRKVRGAAYYEGKKQLNKLKAQAQKNVAGKLSKVNEQLNQLGF